MGEVIEIQDRVDRSLRRDEAAAEHPALRWIAGTAFYVAHRKTPTGAACGAAGDLFLAPPGVPRCVTCWPVADRE